MAKAVPTSAKPRTRSALRRHLTGYLSSLQGRGPWGGLAVGMGITVMVVTYLRTLFDRTAQVEREVVARIAELSQANAELQERAAQARSFTEYLSALQDTTLGLVTHLELKDLLETTVSRAAELMGTSHGCVYLVEPDGSTMTIQVGIGIHSSCVGSRLRPGEGLAGRVWQTGQPLTVADYFHWSGRLTDIHPETIQAMVGEPLKSGAEVVGVIALSYVEEGRTISPSEAAILHRFAHLASVALDNARLYTTLQHELAERTQAQAALTASEERYRLLLEASPDPIVLYDMQDRVTYVNPAFVRTFGWTWDELRGRRLDFVPPEYMEETQIALQRLLSGGRYTDFESRRLTKDGQVLDVLLSGAVYEDRQGQPVGIMVILRDFTSRKQAEDELETAKEAAVAANRAKSTFLANMSHELRTPLNAIIGYSEMVLEEMANSGRDDLTTDLEKIGAAGRHLLSLISDILDLSKIEAGKIELHLEPIDVAHLVQEVTTTVQPIMKKNANTLQVVVGDGPGGSQPELGVMYADLTKVRQVLLNLLSNAAKFTQHGVVTLTVGRVASGQGADLQPEASPQTPEWIVFSVHDTGIGISPEHMGRLFHAFSQADPSTTRKYGGTGLGLAISYHFCQLMGGSIDVESALGRGSIFTVYLPAQVTLSRPALGKTRVDGLGADATADF